MRTRNAGLAVALPLAAALLASACWSHPPRSSGPSASAASGATITAVGAENEYANVIEQIGGKYVERQRDR